MNILIIGAGRIGSAMAFVLKQHHPKVWDIDESRLKATVNCDLEMRRAEIIFLCIPTSAHETTCKKIVECAQKNVVIISLAKGLDEKGRTVPEILGKFFENKHYGILCGPMMAEEILSGQPAFAILAMSVGSKRKMVRGLFSHTDVFVKESDDITGVAWLSILKNVYAMLWGAAQALKLGQNFNGFIMSYIMREMRMYVATKRGNAETIFSPAGIGDLFCTISSPYSRNTNHGASFVTHASADEGEGARAVLFLSKKLGAKIKKFPCMYATLSLVMCSAEPATIFKRLIARVYGEYREK